MANTPITLAWFFANEGGASASDSFDAHAILSSIEAQARDLPRESLLGVNSQFSGCVDQILDIPLGGILGAAWEKSAEFREALDSSQETPNANFDVSLVDHEIQSVHRPGVKMYYGQALVARVDFEVDLSLRLEAVRLVIRNGRIEEIQTGTCSGAGELKWSNIVLVKGSTRQIDLPGNIRLG